MARRAAPTSTGDAARAAARAPDSRRTDEPADSSAVQPEDDPLVWAWAGAPRPRFLGGNRLELLRGGDALFPRICAAIGAAQHEVWLATYIFDTDAAGRSVADALIGAARRGVAVHLVIDGFGSLHALHTLAGWFDGEAVRFEIFRPLDRWTAWLQPGQLRRLHQKLCAIDQGVAWVGGINVIDDRHDLRHGWTDAPRLDFAVEISGPLVAQVHATARAMWSRAKLGNGWRDEVRALARSARPLRRTVAMLRRIGHSSRSARAAPAKAAARAAGPMRAAFIVRDNLRQRRAIERSFIDAIRAARTRVDIAVPYFYPGHGFLSALRGAAKRGVRVRLLLQGKIDYRIAALAARALYDELRVRGVRIHEYTPAFLHAKVAVVDDDWATVGSSNIDPLSLLLNLEANIVVRDRDFALALAQQFDAAVAVSTEVGAVPPPQGWRGWHGWVERGVVAWCASVYLRVAGITGRY